MGHSGRRNERDDCAGGEANKRGETHLPPTITIRFILFDDLDAIASAKGNFIVVLRDEVVKGVNVFNHGKSGGMEGDGVVRFSLRGGKEKGEGGKLYSSMLVGVELATTKRYRGGELLRIDRSGMRLSESHR